MHKRILWVALSAAVGGSAVYFLKKKGSSSASAGSAEPTVPGQADVSSAPKFTGEAVYSFISGFQDASAVELHFPYDADSLHYFVAEDDFLVESGDSHVGILQEDRFSAQFEYGSYYAGEDFSKLRQELLSRHPDLSDVQYGSMSGVKYRDGDNICLAFPIPNDSYSYLLISMIKAPDNDDELDALPDYPEFRALLAASSFTSA